MSNLKFALVTLAVLLCTSCTPKDGARFILQNVIPGNVTFRSDVTDPLDRLGIPYVFVDELPPEAHSTADAYTDGTTIYFKNGKGIGNFGANRFKTLASHEAAHILSDAYSVRIGEAVAVYSVNPLAALLGYNAHLVSPDEDFLAQLLANGLPEEELTIEEKVLVDQEVLKVLTRAHERLKEKWYETP